MSRDPSDFRPFARMGWGGKAASHFRGLVQSDSQGVGGRSFLSRGQIGTVVYRSPGGFSNSLLSGVTRDSSGAVIGTCRVELFVSSSDQLIFATTSDASGNFSFSNPGTGPFYIVAYKSGSPDVAGTTVNTLVASIVQPYVPPVVATVVLRSPDFYDDFELPLGTSALIGRANWTAQDQTTNNLEVKDGYIHGINQYSLNGWAFFGGDIGDQVATFGYSTIDGNGDAYDGTRVIYYLWYRDTNNYCSMTFDKSLGRLYFHTVVGGTDSYNHFTGVTFGNSGEIKVFLRGGIFEAMVDGIWAKTASGTYSWPLDKINLSASIPSPNRSGRLGVYDQLFRFPILNSIQVETMGLYVNAVEEFVGRTVLTGAGQGGYSKLTMTMASVASPTGWYYRLLSEGTLAVVQDWAPLSSIAVAGASVTALAFLPTGGPYIIQPAYIDASDGLARAAYSRAATCGVLIGVWGQSNAYNRAGPPSDVVPLNVKTATAASQIGGGTIAGQPLGDWATYSNGYFVSCMYEMSKTLSTLIGMPVGIFATGNVATPLLYNCPSGGGWATLTTYMAAIRGTVEVFLWDQGEGDADGGFSPTTYSADFRSQLLPGLRGVGSSPNPNVWVGISPVGRYADTTPPNVSDGAANNDLRRHILQQQYLDIIANEAKVFISDYKVGITHGATGGGYHYDGSVGSYPQMGIRAAYTVANKVFGVSTAEGTGAYIVSGTRTTNVIDLTVNLNGGSGLSGPTSFATGTVPTPTLTSLYGYQVSTDNFATCVTINSVSVVAGKIRLTLASNPGTTVKVRKDYGWSYDDTNEVYTTYADGRDAIPVAPLINPITVT